MDPISIALGLSQFAPALAKWLVGDKAGVVTEKVIGIAETVAGKSGISAVDEIRRNDSLQQEFNYKVMSLITELERANLADISDARQREIKIKKIAAENGGDDNTNKNLAYIITAGFFVALFAIPFLPIDGAERDIVMTLIGVLGAKFSGVIDYFFGSSRGSSEKNKLLELLNEQSRRS